MPAPCAQNANASDHHCHCEIYNEGKLSGKNTYCSISGRVFYPQSHKCEFCGSKGLSPDFAKIGFCKEPFNHCWESPNDQKLRGRAASSMLSTQDVSKSSTQSGLTFEGGVPSNAQKNTGCPTGTAANSLRSSPNKPNANGDYTLSADPCSDATITSRKESPISVRASITDVDSSVQCEAHQKERINRWSNEEGKMLVQSDVFNSVLPSADEVGLQWRISELRVALQASERLRLESEQETEALRKYLAEIESVAAGLQSRVKELEQQLSFSTQDDSRELDKLRAQLVIEVSAEARNETAKAAKAIAAAREATMELDKVKRHASSLIKAQEEEAERLRMEAAECRTLYQARAVQIQALKDQVEKLEQKLGKPSEETNETLRVAQEEIISLQKNLEAVKNEAQEKNKQFADLLNAYQLQGIDLQSAENLLQEFECQRTELSSQKEQLEQQVADLQNAGNIAAPAVYDHELCKVRAALGAEKQHLLMELAMMRSKNQNLQSEVAKWQEKFLTLSTYISEMKASSILKSNVGDEVRVQSVEGSPGNSHENRGSCNYHQCLDSPKLSSDMNTAGAKIDGQERIAVNNKDASKPKSSFCASPQGRAKRHTKYEISAHNKENWPRDSCPEQQLSITRDYGQHRTGCNLLKDSLLAAAHKEITRLKEINQYLMAACKDDFRPCRRSDGNGN